MMNQNDLFKACAQDIRVYEKVAEITHFNLDSEESRLRIQKYTLKLYMRIWSGLTKYIRSQCSKGRAVDTAIFGWIRIDQGDEQNNPEMTTEFDTFYYHPSTKFLDEAVLTLYENEYNFSPFTSPPKKCIKMNINGISSV